MHNGRRTFVLSRGLEYFSESELNMQIGRGREGWPIAILKELVDNALDAAETAGVAPVVDIETSYEGFLVRDNGPGIPKSTIEGSLDYNVRVSNKLGYVTPTRGRLGNALMVVWAAPYVDADESRIIIRTQGRRHEINVRLDRIEQQPAVDHDVHADTLQNGTEIHLAWPNSASLLSGAGNDDFYKNSEKTARELVEEYSAFNPHATFTLDGVTYPATCPDWKKWKPNDRLCAHWYTSETFRDLVAHYVASERYGADPVTIRAFVSGFRGLSSTGKQKVITAGFKRDQLSELVEGDDLDDAALSTLLTRMKAESRPPRPSTLGVLGKEALIQWMVNCGDVEEGSIKYRKVAGSEGGMPFVMETVFGVHREDCAGDRRIVTGMNWSPTLGIPIREIRSVLQAGRIDANDPVTYVIHLVRPEWNYTGRGKGSVVL